MKPLAVVLATVLLALQYPLWVGKGSWLRVWSSIAASPPRRTRTRN
jgi:cell division protein FtsB